MRRKSNPATGYAIALLFSIGAIAIIGVIEPVLGFIPMLMLSAVALVEFYAGPKPAALTTFLCVVGSVMFAGAHPMTYSRIHNLATLAIFPVVAASIVFLMESRRKQKQVSREQLLELSTLLESMPEAVVIVNPFGRIVVANAAAEHLSGRNKLELIGRPYMELAGHYTVLRDEKPLTIPDMAVTRALDGEPIQNEKRVFLNPSDGSQMDIVVSANPMHSDDGKLISALVVVRDMTEIAQLQRRVADTERHLAIGQMASGIAHDFNNVLNTITQATALMEMRPDQAPEERHMYLGMIDRAARTGAEIIKQVREYIRGGTGEVAPVDVPLLLQESIDLTKPMWRRVKGLTVTAELKPVAKVRANPADLRRVFTNLIINAIQAMPSGGKLEVACDEHDGVVTAWVSDTGTGIAPELQKKIFLPYFTTKTTGTGLGLSTAQKILLAHGGNINFMSEHGKGTRFVVELPVTKQEIAKVA